MRRRTFLVASASLALTGRLGAGERPPVPTRSIGAGGAGSTSGDARTAAQSGSTQPSPTPSSDVLVETEPAELVEYEQFGEVTVAARGVVTNASDRRLPYVEVSADFLDGSDAIVGQRLSNLAPLAPGRGWKYNVDYASEADVPPSAVTSADVSIGYSDVAVSQPANDLTVVESELVEIEQFGERTKAVRGTIRNVGETTHAFVEVEAQFLDDSDVVVGAFWSTIEDLEPARGWRFQVDYHSESDAPASEVVGYDLFVST